ncbi:tyrosine-protein phosphatase [Fervidobacterium thailandense]|uniref:protein-tyrosine-phosphatase n=1 Tax=Fervidobacterium thailandense TaxID=1008305 RepID=A0A1E3G4D3_9BACT|nr:CpsB/CapC family capsule biosynthesis tyrosine phosphatase [Fervidobacterium thailandense]ODN30980.1 hypothetical protein A4H02_01505 [Fervidobacterium thailandense]
MLDIHCHVLFGVDDGVETLDESLQILNEYKKNGVDCIVLTPHICHPTVKSDPVKIRENFNVLLNESAQIGVKLFLGSELYLTPRPGNFIPIRDRFVLVELDTINYPLYLFDTIFQLQLDGYEVILAHVERYQWLRENARIIRKLKDMNVYFQMNLDSIETDKFYMKEGYVEFLGTDYHGTKRGTINWNAFKRYKELIERSKKILNID